MANPINNALSNFDNIVKETTSGKSGFLTGALSSIMDKTGLGSTISNLTSNLSNSVNSFMSDKIKKLNELTTTVFGKINAKIPVQLKNFLSKYLQQGLDLLKIMGSDLLNKLKNAGVTYLNNIVENFVENLKSTIYISDEVFCKDIEGLYYAGADLAYNDHYLRKQCLSRDWSYTLEFVDKQYGIDYNYNYQNLAKDVITCATNSCYKNLLYIFDKIYKQIQDLNKDITLLVLKIEDIQRLSPDTYQNMEDYSITEDQLEYFKQILETLTHLMLYGTKQLIVYSYTYLAPSKLRKFFDKYSDILKPKYFGTNDDKYNQKYCINSTDLDLMMPLASEHKKSQTDSNVLEIMNNESDEIQKLAEFEQVSQENRVKSTKDIISEFDTLSKDGMSYNDFKAKENEIRAAKVSNVLGELKSNIISNYTNSSKTLSNTAITQGSSAVYNASIEKYKSSGQNDLKEKVKYRSSNIGTALSETFDTSDDYIIPRNKNIKQIYVLLASYEIFNGDRMINDVFYTRCKYSSEESIASTLDKAKGILGTSIIAQTGYDLSDAIDGTAYNYTKKFESYLLDPSKNTELEFQQLVNQSLQLNPDFEEVLNESNEYNTMNIGENDSKRGVNNDSNKQITDLLNVSDANRFLLVSYMRYVSNIPMVEKRDLIISWLTRFYNSMVDYDIENHSEIFTKLNKYVFGKSNITEPNVLMNCFEYSSNDSLNDNCKILVGIEVCDIEDDVMDLINNPQRNTIINLFKMSIKLFENNIRNEGFVKSIFLYDKEYLLTYLKTLFNNVKDIIKKLNKNDNLFYKKLYDIKDLLTTNFTGFDRKGIFGYDIESRRVKYTNIEIGDWISGAVTKNGTFFGGSDNTSNNGIVRLNESTKVFEKTNITSGNWTKIIEFGNYVFFIKDNSEIYYLKNSKIVQTGISDFENYEFVYISNYDLLLLSSKNNTGFLYWNGSDFKSVTDIGSNWNYKSVPSGYIIYPTTDPGYIYVVNSSKQFGRIDLNKTVTDISYYIETITIPPTQDQQQDNSQNSLNPTYKYDLFILIGTTDSGLYSVETRSSSQNFNIIQVNNVQNRIWSSGFVIPNRVSDNITTCLTNSGDHQLIFRTSSTATGTGTSYIPTPKPEFTIINNERLFSATNITFYKIFTNCIYFNDNDEINYCKNLLDNSINQLTNVSHINTEDFEEINGEIYSKNSTSKTGYYKYINYSRTAIMSVEDMAKTGWKLHNLNDRFVYATNEDEPLGVRYLSNNEFISTGLNTGYWILNNYGALVIAASINNSNLGIKYSTVTNLSSNFVNLLYTPITEGDYGCIISDEKRKLVYITNNRSNLTFDIDRINYDIDEFLFYMYDLEKQNIISNTHNGLLNILHDNLTNLAKDNINVNDTATDLFAIIDILNEFMLAIEKSSSIYNDLMFYAEAKTEFNIDDNDVLNRLLADFIYNYDYEKDRSSAIATALNRMKVQKFIIGEYNIPVRDSSESSESYKNRLSEYRRVNISTSDEYMNSED